MRKRGGDAGNRSSPNLTLGAIILASSLACAQGTTPHPKVTEYPVHVSAPGNIEIGGEYLVHSIPIAKGMLFAQDFLVFEVGIYGPTLTVLKVSPQQFVLRINGKQLFAPSPIYQVTGAIGGSNWQHPAQQEVDKEGQIIAPPDEQVTKAAFPEAEQKLPVSGLLFFAFRGKMKTIQTVELIYSDKDAKTVIKFP
jgi:hypothetical protein